MLPRQIGEVIAVHADAEERLREERDVLDALAKGRHLDRHHREAKVEIVTERAASGRFFVELAGRRREDAHVAGHGLGAADAPELAGLEHAQELGLEVERELSDFVEEDGAAGRALEGARARRYRAGQRAALVPEDLTLDERSFHPATVHDLEGSVRAGAFEMDMRRIGRLPRHRAPVGS